MVGPSSVCSVSQDGYPQHDSISYHPKTNNTLPKQIALPPGVQATLWHGYVWCRFRARKHYWRWRNAALRCWREWTDPAAATTTSEVCLLS